MKDLINNPDYLAYKFNFSTEHVEFMQITRGEMHQANSLSRHVIDAQRPLIPVPLSQLVPTVNAPCEFSIDNSPRFVFHTAFCASTFLSRCLEVPGISVSLREPQILLDAANAKRLQWRSKSTPLDFRHMPRLAIALLRKHARTDEKLLIKPINSVNNIIPELLKITGPGKALMLYTDAKNFLLSTLKKGEESKHSVRAMFDLIRCDFPQLANLRISDTIRMTDLKVILTLWRLHIEQAEQALSNFSSKDRMASLYGEHLVVDPLKPLLAVNEFLQLGIPSEQIEKITNSDSRFEDAKRAGEKFSIENRKEAYRKVEAFYGNELDNGLRWMTQNNPGTHLVPRLTGGLIR